MKKRLFAIVMAATMSMATVMTSFAYTTVPGWCWVNGYCYYYTDPEHTNLLKSCTTPDGYKVDELGRWTENGIPQYNGYGTKVMGTDQLYAGLDDNQRILAIGHKLDEIYKGYGHQLSTTFAGSYPVFSCHISGGSEPYLYFENVWNDSPECYVSNRSEFYEQAIKLLVGDHVGQELFDQIRAAAEPNIAGGSVLARDANGHTIDYVDADGFVRSKLVPTASRGNGVDFSLINWRAWNGRKTDYGKTIEIYPGVGTDPSDHPSGWSIYIKF